MTRDIHIRGVELDVTRRMSVNNSRISVSSPPEVVVPATPEQHTLRYTKNGVTTARALPGGQDPLSKIVSARNHTLRQQQLVDSQGNPLTFDVSKSCLLSCHCLLAVKD